MLLRPETNKYTCMLISTIYKKKFVRIIRPLLKSIPKNVHIERQWHS